MTPGARGGHDIPYLDYLEAHPEAVGVAPRGRARLRRALLFLLGLVAGAGWKTKEARDG